MEAWIVCFIFSFSGLIFIMPLWYSRFAASIAGISEMISSLSPLILSRNKVAILP
jgi:hypothetical protein